MGLFSARFAAASRPGRQNLPRTQPHVRRPLLYVRAARSFCKEGRRRRARTNFFRERITLLAYAAVARTDARTNVLARFLCREVKYVTLGCNLFGNCPGGGAVWIYGHCCGRSGNGEVSLLSFPCDLPDFFNHRHLGRQKDPVITAVLMMPPEW